MKQLICLLLLSPLLAGAQTTIFTTGLSGLNEVPPNNSTFTGLGHFTLSGSNLNCVVEFVPAFNPTSGGIYGPAIAGQNGSLIFDFGQINFLPPTGAIGYDRDFTLTRGQIADLLNDRLYVNLTSVAFPHGEIRGQIQVTAAPEPSVFACLGLGLIALGAGRRANLLRRR
jgi:hypothetical protein